MIDLGLGVDAIFVPSPREIAGDMINSGKDFVKNHRVAIGFAATAIAAGALYSAGALNLTTCTPGRMWGKNCTPTFLGSVVQKTGSVASSAASFVVHNKAVVATTTAVIALTAKVAKYVKAAYQYATQPKPVQKQLEEIPQE